jgi:hypothetical protein
MGDHIGRPFTDIGIAPTAALQPQPGTGARERRAGQISTSQGGNSANRRLLGIRYQGSVGGFWGDCRYLTAGAALLRDVGQLMGAQRVSDGRTWPVFARSEGNVCSQGNRPRTLLIAQQCPFALSMGPHVATGSAEARSMRWRVAASRGWSSAPFPVTSRHIAWLPVGSGCCAALLPA